MATMQERLRQHKRRRRLRIMGRLVAIVLVGYALHYGWVAPICSAKKKPSSLVAAPLPSTSST